MRVICVAMPNIDDGAKAFELALAGRVGAAVQARRKALDLTAAQLADRTRDLGYPITRVAISKIETNKRAGKLDVAELFILAAALEVPPALLLFPGFPHDTVEAIPGKVADNLGAVKWLSGRSGWQVTADNAGTELVELVARRAELDDNLFQLRLIEQTHASDSARRTIAELEAKLAATRAQITQVQAELWGTTDA